VKTSRRYISLLRDASVYRSLDLCDQVGFLLFRHKELGIAPFVENKVALRDNDVNKIHLTRVGIRIITWVAVLFEGECLVELAREH